MCIKFYDSVSLFRKKLYVYFLYFLIDILVFGMQFLNVYVCLSVCGFFYYYEVVSELIFFKFEVLFIFICSIICFYGCDIYIFIKLIQIKNIICKLIFYE